MRDSSTEIVLESGRVHREYFKDLWRFRELFLFLAWRDVLIRYKEAFFGIAWALFRPIITMAIFSVVFGRIAGLSSQGAPYLVFVMVAMLPWQFFSNAVLEMSASLLGNANLISKIYFPRLVVPSSVLIVNSIDWIVGTLVLILLILGYHLDVYPLRVVFLSVLIIQVLVLTLGVGWLLAALCVRYRDFRFVIPFLLQIGLYASPVGYGSFAVPDSWRMLYSLNPIVGIIDGFRWALLGQESPFLLFSILVSGLISGLMFFVGLYYFRKVERDLADFI